MKKLVGLLGPLRGLALSLALSMIGHGALAAEPMSFDAASQQVLQHNQG